MKNNNTTNRLAHSARVRSKNTCPDSHDNVPASEADKDFFRTRFQAALGASYKSKSYRNSPTDHRRNFTDRVIDILVDMMHWCDHYADNNNYMDEEFNLTEAYLEAVDLYKGEVSPHRVHLTSSPAKIDWKGW